MTPEAMRDAAAVACELQPGRTVHIGCKLEGADRDFAIFSNACTCCAKAIRQLPIPPAAAQEGETPRTDAWLEANRGKPCSQAIDAELVRGLERDLAAANARADEAESARRKEYAAHDSTCLQLKGAEQSLAAVRELLAISDGALDAANRTIEWQIKELAALKGERG